MISGVNIKLRPFQLEDASHIQALKKDVDGIRAFAGSPFPGNLESEKEWIGNMYPKGMMTMIYFVIEEIDTGIFAGYCAAREIDYLSRNADVGIILSEAVRGKGYFKEVSYVFYHYLFQQLNMYKLYSTVIKGNFVLKPDKDIGFVEEGMLKEHLYQDGEYKDLHAICLLRENFYTIWKDGLSHFKKR